MRIINVIVYFSVYIIAIVFKAILLPLIIKPLFGALLMPLIFISGTKDEDTAMIISRVVLEIIWISILVVGGLSYVYPVYYESQIGISGQMWAIARGAFLIIAIWSILIYIGQVWAGAETVLRNSLFVFGTSAYVAISIVRNKSSISDWREVAEELASGVNEASVYHDPDFEIHDGLFDGIINVNVIDVTNADDNRVAGFMMACSVIGYFFVAAVVYIVSWVYVYFTFNIISFKQNAALYYYMNDYLIIVLSSLSGLLGKLADVPLLPKPAFDPKALPSFIFILDFAMKTYVSSCMLGMAKIVFSSK